MSNPKKIIFLPGDGIGPEIVSVAFAVLEHLKKQHSLEYEYEYCLAGGSAYDEYGTPLPDDTLSKALKADAVFLGAVGGYRWDDLPFDKRPEQALLGLRKNLQLYTNIRPIKVYPDLISSSPLKEKVVTGVDLVILRELTGDLYFGEPRYIKTTETGKIGINTMQYTEKEIKRIAKVAFELAKQRSKRLCSVDKANVLEVSRLWRDIVIELAKDYPEVELTHQYVDNAAMQLVQNPSQFDCILTGNMFGDILSDLAAVIPGSIGLLSSVSLSDHGALFEPIHGSAPDIAGKNIANPIAAIKCIGMMLSHTFNAPKLEQKLDAAIDRALKQGRTPDIKSDALPLVSTSQMGALIISEL